MATGRFDWPPESDLKFTLIPNPLDNSTIQKKEDPKKLFRPEARSTYIFKVKQTNLIQKCYFYNSQTDPSGSP
jgi:hypothetical protein